MKAINSSQPQPVAAAIFAAIALLGWVDYATGFELGFFSFYLLPILVASTRFGVNGAVISSVASAAAWSTADFFSGHQYSANIYFAWNMLVRLATFLVVGLAYARIRRLLAAERQTNNELRRAKSEIKVLEGLLPICSECKSIRDSSGKWTQLESYISQRSDAEFSHGYCPVCFKRAMHESGITEDSKKESPAV